MTAQPERQSATPESESLLPPPVSGGGEHIQSLGRFIDRMMFDRKDRIAAATEIASMVSDDRAPVQDPPPIEPPSPVSDGNDMGTRGGSPGEAK